MCIKIYKEIQNLRNVNKLYFGKEVKKWANFEIKFFLSLQFDILMPFLGFEKLAVAKNGKGI